MLFGTETDEEAPVEEVDYSQISVQELYRPVLQQNIPAVPPFDKRHPDFIWWLEQFRRIIYGWVAPDGKYLNGYLYFYLNFVKIPLYSKKDKAFVWKHPLYRDEDDIILSKIWSNRQQSLPGDRVKGARNFIGAKPRGIGWTMYTLLGVALYHFIFTPDKPIGCAYPDDKQNTIERNWFIKAWKDLHDVFKRYNGHDLEVINNSDEMFSIGQRAGKMNDIHNYCMFHTIGSNSAGVYKGERMRVMIAVEAGKWKGESLKNYVSENEPSARLGDDAWGMFIIGGTSNAIINKSTQYKEMYEEAESFNAIKHFTPKTRVLAGHFDEFTGKSNEVTALASIVARRELMKGDATRYQQEVIENPLTIEECFIPNVAFAYDAGKIAEQIQYIRENHLDHKWVRGSLSYVRDINGQVSKTRVEFTQYEKGEWLVNLQGMPDPRYNNLHIAGVDDRYKDRDPEKKVSKDASRNAMIIYRQPNSYVLSDMPVAMYLGELPSMTESYEEFWKGILYWNVSKTLYEYNHEGFVSHLRQKGEINKLHHTADGRPGVKIGPKEKTDMTYLGNVYFSEERYKNITCIPILEALAIWGSKENTDIGSAMHLIFHLLEVTKNSLPTTVNEHQEHTQVYIKLNERSDIVISGGFQSGSFVKLGRRSA